MALSTVVFVGETREWLDELVERAKALKVDGGFEKGADLGPVITPQSKERVERLIQSGVDEGATLALDGRGYKPPKYPNGNFVGPTVSPPTQMSFFHFLMCRDPGGRDDEYGML
jgi:malonate-semialdehyde dehydrogenase (acetylating)/methylmalonate-semialdehyde dehydrogenase